MSQAHDQIYPSATPSLTGVCGRADLLFALASVQKNATYEITGREIALAEIFGFFPEPEKQLPDEETVQISPETIPPEKEASGTETTAWPDVFHPYRLVAVETVEAPEAGQTKRQDVIEAGKLTHADMDPWDASRSSPQFQPIVPWTRLWPKLRQAVATRHPAGIDYPRLTECLARGLSLRQLPRLTRLAWPDPLTVILDFSDRLTPYWDDWHWFREQVQTRLHKQARFFRLHGVPFQPLQALINGKPSGRFEDWPWLNAGSTLLLVSDLGMVDPAHPWPGACWQNRLNAYRRQGVRVVVLAPVSARHVQPALVNAAQTVRLSPDSTLRPVSRMRADKENSFRSEAKDDAAGNALLAMLSVATRVEPALLRALRRCLPAAGGDAGLEGEVWCHEHLDTSALACAVSPFAVKPWRDEFLELDKALQQRTLDCLREWHASLPQAIHHEETLLWFYLTDCQAEAKEAANLHKAREFFKKVTHSLQDKDNISRNPAAYALQLQLADRHVHWAAPILATHEPYMTPLSVAVTLADTERSTSLPDGLDPIAWLQALPVQTPQTLNLIQQADLSLSLNADFTPETAASGASPLAGLALNRPVVLWALDEGGQPLTYQPWHWQTAPRDNAPVLPELLSLPDESLKPAASLRILTGRQQIRFERLAMPSWAAGMGQDNDGLCADLEFKGITQRFRWINPGMFMMGSSNDEAERFDNELQHQVTLTRGYWLADTTCTIALWEAVMDKNTSTFKENPDNPVENVSWDDVQAFIQRLNQSLPGLSSRLPSEAEWEYACRGGTSTPFSFGENITTEQVNYNGGYPYAGGVKGEYRGKTLPVKSLPTNSWGLYGIHGNVWEWCADWYGDYESGMAVDPAGPRDGSDRVLRGGSWFSHAGYTRSASRGRNIPAVRYDYYGFRLALGRTGKSPEEQEGRYTAAGRFGEGVRLHKFLADRGKYGSRRSIEAKISEGRIWINGRKASIGDRYYPGDTIHIDGRSIDLYEFLEKTEVILYYKAKGEVVSHNDPKNRPTVFDHLPEPQQGKWMAAGRMGIKNEGLLLLTTNGELANQLNQKLHSIPCSYQVRVFGEIDNDAVARLTEGLVAKGGTINRFESIEPLGRQESSNRWYKIQVNDGRSAYLDTILKSQEIVFNRVIRTKFADVELPKDMKAGEYEALEQEQYLSLMALVGL